MTPHLRTARACTAATGLLTASACYSATFNPWLALPGLYAAAFFAWCAARCYAAHQRLVAEHDWARRRALGDNPPPLNPCCMLAHYSEGAAHDPRCTRPRPDVPLTDQERAAFQQITNHYDHGTAA
ncbi:hypothetical protein ACIQCF_07415 [Streptomyces sp. NPDC088353]|uniref:hypothetical protein n=1 Tax=Streptomyces sp. NPDC088353 TaxID=3365855 RepID=UPI00380FCD79